MKNFTKQNFKTNPLWIRLLIMTFMLLLGSSSAWAATQRYIYVGISNNYYQYKDNSKYGFNFWGGTSGGVKTGTYLTTHTHDGRKYYMYRVQVYDDNNKAQFKGNDNWWDPGDGFSVTLNGTSKNAIFFSHSNDGWQGQFQNNYQETSTASLAASATSVNTNTNVTLTPSLSTNATYNEIKSTSYSISPSSGASISSNTFKATAAGTYTVTATVTYNPKYFTGITKTATATATITVKQACTDPSNIKFTVTSPKNTYYLGDQVAATLSYDGTEVQSGHSWTYDNTAIGISGPAPTKGASFTFTLKKVTNSTDIKINLPKCSSGTVASSALNFAITALPAPTGPSGTGSTTSATLNWTPNNTYKTVMVVRYAKDAAVTAPTQGTAYTAGSNKIGNGTVVYKGTETSFTNTGLTTGNSYDYYFYTVNNNYYSTNVKATVSTCVNVVEPAVTMSPANGAVCQGSPVTLTLTTRQSGVVYKIGDEEIFKSTTTYEFVPKTNSVTVTASHENACDGTNDKTKTFNISIKSLPEAPVFESNSMTVCAGEPFSLPKPTNLKEGTEDCIWSVEGESTTGSQPGISQTTIYTAVKNDGCPSPSVEFTVNVTPKPTITASNSKASYAPYEVITLTSAAGAGTTWSTTENGILSATTGETVTFKAPAGTYIVTASANDCIDTKTITVECAAEDCSGAQSTDVIITCDPNGYTGDVYCHIWPYGGQGIVAWPGTLGEKVDGIWTWTFSGLKSNTTYDLILNGGDGKGQTNDIDQNVVPGNQYDYTLVHNGWPNSKTTVTKATPKAITVATNPTVTTVSAEQKEGEPTVVIKGFLQATGCATITNVGYQYKLSTAEKWEDMAPAGTAQVCDEWEVECSDLEFGETYMFRAKATNAEGLKGYGEKIELTIQGQSTPVVIKAVRNDRTVNENHWADFVALYVQEEGISTAGAGATKATKYTWEYSTDGENWDTNFTGYVLGGASAKVGVTNGSEKCNNIRPTKTGKYRLKITYDNDAVQESNIITITSDGFKLKYPEYGQNAGSDFTFEAANRTIPVFVVKTTENFPDCPASGMPSQDVEGQKAKKSVDVKIFENGNVVYDRKARMNYRGSSSLNFRKKSYAFCTGKEKTKNNKGDVDTGKENLFGLSNGAKDKDWVLYAAMPDPSMMRNRLMFDTYAQMTGTWGVNSMFVELIIDDEYKGVYVLMDKVTNNEDRINITDKNGFILKFDKTDVSDRFENEESDKRNTFTTYYTGKSDIGSYGATFDQRFEIEYPEMEDMTTEKWIEFVNDNVFARIKNFEDALAAGNYSEVRNIIDYVSWADWFIISEFAKNVDAYRASCLFVYNGNKIEARPLWDQELSFNNTATTVGDGKGCNITTGLLINNDGVYSDAFPAPFWFTGRKDGSTDEIKGWLLNDPCFVSVVQKRWKDHLNNALSADQLNGKIADYQEELTAKAQDREIATWRPESGEITACTDGGTGYNNIKVSTSIKTMTDWLEDRPEGLSAALDELKGNSIKIEITPSFVETYPWEPFTLEVNAPESYEYDMAFTKEGVDATTDMEVQKVNDTYTIRIKRPSNTLDYVFSTVPYLATAKVKVDDDGCGGMAKPEANVNIRLNDREEVCEP